MSRYEDVLADLRTAYDTSADERDRAGKTPWKVEERAAFLERIRSEGKTTLLEIGAGTGQDSAFFQVEGLDVLATDPSPEMVRRCREKGLNAQVADIFNLPEARFDAVYSLNVLLHVPNADLPRALDSIADVLQPRGLFFLGVYGGDRFEGISPDDWHTPPRFFSFRTDAELEHVVGQHFDIVDFHVVEPHTDGAVATGAAGSPVHFQSMTLRKPRG